MRPPKYGRGHASATASYDATVPGTPTATAATGLQYATKQKLQQLQ
jgi:hypothetical protein